MATRTKAQAQAQAQAQDEREVMNTIGAAMVLAKEIDWRLLVIGGEGGHIAPAEIDVVSSLVTAIDVLVENLVGMCADQHPAPLKAVDA